MATASIAGTELSTNRVYGVYKSSDQNPEPKLDSIYYSFIDAERRAREFKSITSDGWVKAISVETISVEDWM